MQQKKITDLNFLQIIPDDYIKGFIQEISSNPFAFLMVSQLQVEIFYIITF